MKYLNYMVRSMEESYVYLWLRSIKVCKILNSTIGVSVYFISLYPIIFVFKCNDNFVR